MASEDSLDFAQAAIVRVADVASLLGVQYKRPVCGRLGAELLLVADYLDTAGFDQEEQLRLRIPKLLRDVEIICSVHWPKKTSRKSYPLLETIARAPSSSPLFIKAQAEIRQGLDNITSKTGVAAEKAILHIQRFTNHNDEMRREPNQVTPTNRSPPAEYPGSINVLVYNVLREHTCCTCQSNRVQRASSRHLARLLLRPPQLATIKDQVRFDMLFSSTPSWHGSHFRRWQDVQLTVPRVRKKSSKRARFSDHNNGSPRPLSSVPLEQVDQGQFCNLISLEANSRICLAIQDGKLQKSGFGPLQQIVEHIPGISLAKILEHYHLTAKMKLALAYILAHSVWQYYDSDWMKTRWTSETIQFMKECGRGDPCGQGRLNIYAWKPYLSVRFGEEDPGSTEFSSADGEIHRYSRIRALGIMLVEIGIGLPLHRSQEERPTQSLAAKINEDLLLAIEYTRDLKRWRDCDYPNYLGAVNHCLDPGIFALAPYIRGVDEEEEVEARKQRRNILYDKVVFPLEELLLGTGWMEQLAAIGPIDTPAKSSTVHFVEQCSADNVTVGPLPIRKAARKDSTGTGKAAKQWLSRMQHLNNELTQTFPRMVPGSCSARIRIAVLDTGCDDDAPFFHHPDNRPRLVEWKDWVDESEQWQDCHGHGTHLTSLVMKTAPEAHIYIARIAKSPETLLDASENVAKAISWASKEWKADIISMSFGYAKEQQCISRAIRLAQVERDDSILFFAAASNYGANDKEMFPANHDSVISMRGTNANGYFEDFNPPRNWDEQTVFGTLGLDVPSAWLSSHNDEVYKSGTSVATAIAAGIACSLLGYASCKSEEGTFLNINRKLRTRKGMQAMFGALAVLQTQQQNCLYLTPWKLMDKSEEEREAIFVAALSDVP